MSTPVLIALILVSASICPLMMWVGQRRRPVVSLLPAATRRPA